MTRYLKGKWLACAEVKKDGTLRVHQLRNRIQESIRVPFREEKESYSFEEAAEGRDIEAIGMVDWQYVKQNLHAIWPIPNPRL